jgi:uncharacterized repeat protein (TIGR02543 family)
MKTKLTSLLILVTSIISIIGAAIQPAAVEAIGVGTQNFFISNVSQHPNIIINTNSDDSVVQIPSTSGTPLILSTYPRSEPENVNFSAGNWTGHIALADTSYLGPLKLDIGKYYSGSGPETYGSTTLNCNSLGIDFSISVSSFTLNQNDYLLFQISGTTDSLNLKVGGSNSYFTSPSGSGWYPNDSPPPLYDLVTNGPNGTVLVSPRPPSGGYPVGTTVTLNALPNDGYKFSGWSGGITGIQNPAIVIIDSDKTVTANFVQNTPKYTLAVSVSPQEGGSVEVNPAPENGMYAENTRVALTAKPVAGYSFLNWEGPVADPHSLSTTITLDSDKSVIAKFTRSICSLSLSVDPEGSGIARTSDSSNDYTYGSIVTIIASPNTGYDFVNWEGDVDAPSSAGTKITMDGDKSVVAHFVSNHVEPPRVIHLVVSEFSSPHYVGEALGFTVTAIDDSEAIDLNYHGLVTFSSSDPDAILPEDATLTNGTGTFTVTFGTTGLQTLTVADLNDTSITASRNITLAEAPPIISTYTLKVIKVGNGTVSPDSGNYQYPVGAVVTLSVNPDPGYSFLGWSGALTGTSNPAAVTMDGDKVVTATFTQIEYYLTVIVDPSGAGGVTKSPGQLIYHYGDVVQLKAYAASGYTFNGWSGAASGTANPVNITLDSDKSVIALFILNPVEENGGHAGNSGGGGGITIGKLYPVGFLSKTPLNIDSRGFVQSTASLNTLDGMVGIKIANKTKLLSPEGDPLSILTAEKIDSPRAPPGGNALVRAYSFSPDGATFNPALGLTITYDPASLAEGVSEKDLYIAYWNGTSWESFQSTIDTGTKTITAKITHFSSYALMGKILLPPVPDPSPSPTVKPNVNMTVKVLGAPSPTVPEIKPQVTKSTPTPTPAPQKPSQTPINWIVVIIICIAVIAVVLGVVVAFQRRRND